MPGIPLVTRDISSSGGSSEQMCRRGLHSSEEEEMSAEESLSVYCKPVELYNILQRRAVRNPLFLQRCLSYEIQAKQNRRIQLTISLPMAGNDAAQSQNLFPLYVLLARRVSEVAAADYSAVYRFTRACVLDYFSGVEGNAQAPQANFVLPEINKLAVEAKSSSLTILLVSFAGAPSAVSGIDLTRSHLESGGGCSLLGKIPLDSLYLSWEQSPNLDLGQRAEVMSAAVMNSCFLKLSYLNEDKCLSVQIPSNGETGNALQQVQVSISAEEVGANEKSPYQSYMYSDISSSSLSQIMRLRAGNVIFNYRYYNNKLQKTEVTEDFSCPFCLVKCASFKGLRHHLPASHDLFNFEFWVTGEFQAVNISVKTDIWRSEMVADGVDPKQQTFCFCSRKARRKRSRNLVQHGNYVHSLNLESNLPGGATDSFGRAAGEQLYQDPEDVGFGSAPPTKLQFAKNRKLSTERPELRNRSLLHKRQFFHSHRAQPMAIEQVLSDRDSEDEVDDDVADFEDLRMLDDFVDVTKDEKQMMHMWNSFVRKQRVLADGHIPWACEAFSRLHGHDLVSAPALIWCWRLFMIKLWNHGLLDARTMNTCNIILEQLQKEIASDPTQC